MPFPDIQLDDRTFEDLYAELRRRIPRYTPEWTDHNDSDPGITLLQLFAWLQEMLIWRLNQVPDKNFIKFLELIGTVPDPPAPAIVELTFKLSTKDLTEAVLIPGGTQVSLSGASDGGPVIFTTDDNLYASGADLVALQTFDGQQFQLVTEFNRLDGASFLPFTQSPRSGMALYLGLDRAFPPGQQRLTFHSAAAANTRVQSGASLAVDFAPPVVAVWEYFAGPTALWQPLANITDGTRSLTRSGSVTFDAPADMQAAPYGLLRKQSDPVLYWLRYRLDSILGTGYEAVPDLSDVLVNTIGATNAVTEIDELLGQSNNRPNQTFALARTPVLPKDDSVPGIIAVNEGPGFVVWTEVADFAASTRTDTHYTIDRSTGVVLFGDGVHGKIPLWLSSDGSNLESADAPNIKATSYRWGGGARGNAGSGTVTSLETSIPYVDSVTNLRPSIGGADEETIDHAKATAPLKLRTKMRAVTGEDFQFLATQTPGAQVKRAKALPLHSPNVELVRKPADQLLATPVPIPGTITVIVVPEGFGNPKPLPTNDTLTLVANWLDAHRLVTTELFVERPKYRLVKIVAQIIADPTAISGDVAKALQQKLLAYFHPLTGGKDASGWEFGGKIYFSETYKQILTTPGVLRIDAGALKTIVDGKPPAQDGADIDIGEDELVYSTEHTLTVTYR
jgi:hypothetical protein